MYKLNTSQIQNFLTTDFQPIENNANSAANRPISVVMVTSGGSSYPTTGGDSTGSLDGSTFYTKVRGDGTTTAIIRLKVTGGVIQEFGNGNAATGMQNVGAGYSFASVDLSAANIFSNSNATTPISGATATVGQTQPLVLLHQLLNLLVVMVQMTVKNLVLTLLWFKENLNLLIQTQHK